MIRYSKFILLLIILILFGLIAYWFVGYLESPSVINVVKSTANQINRKCPIMTDEECRLDSVDVIEYPIRSIRMHYTLPNVSISDSGMIEQTRNYFIPRLRDKVKYDPDMKFLRDHSVVVTYIYRDENGGVIFEYPVGPKEWR